MADYCPFFMSDAPPIRLSDLMWVFRSPFNPLSAQSDLVAFSEATTPLEA
jgi:hypothetical protein